MAHGKRRRDSIHETPDVSYITNPDVAHEESDVAVRPLLWFVGGLTLFTLVTCLAMLLMFRFLKGREESLELAPSPLARQGDERLPPEPRLQLAEGWQVTTSDGKRHDLSLSTDNAGYMPQPWSEWLLVNEDWQRELNEYGWADQQAGTVRIPVKDAIDRYLERRAKQQPPQPPGGQPPPANAAPKETTPAESSSGQQPEQKHH